MEQYKCGHPIEEVIINITPESLAMYMEWKNSKSSLCIRCWNIGNKAINYNTNYIEPSYKINIKEEDKKSVIYELIIMLILLIVIIWVIYH